MAEKTAEARHADFNQRAGEAVLNVYKLAVDVEKMVAGWNELTDIAAHIGHSNAMLGGALPGNVVRHTDPSPEEAMVKTVGLVESN